MNRQRIEEKGIETVMTYEQWCKYHKRNKHRRFVRKWNKAVDKIAEIPFRSIFTGIACIGFVVFVSTFGVNKANAAEPKERTALGYYENGVVVTDDGSAYPYYGESELSGRVEVLFDTMGTETTDDDCIMSINK